VKTWALATAEPKTRHNLIDFYQIKTIKTTTYKTIYISLGHGDHWSSFMGGCSASCGHEKKTFPRNILFRDSRVWRSEDDMSVLKTTQLEPGHNMP
jgi:hypothetical protein